MFGLGTGNEWFDFGELFNFFALQNRAAPATRCWLSCANVQWHHLSILSIWLGLKRDLFTCV